MSSPRPASQPLLLTGLGGETVTARLEDVGQGRPVVFLHGLAGLNDHWEEAVRRIQGRVRCLSFELPLLSLRGDDCSIDGVVELTSRFLEMHLGPESRDGRTVLVGNSFGGHVALRIALDRPDLVGGLVLAGSSGLVEQSMMTEIQLRPTRPWLARRIGDLFYDPARHMRESDVDRAYADLTDRAGARAMLKLSKSSRRNNLGSELHKVKAPSLVLWGRNDMITPPEAAHELLAKLPDARIEWFEECGHVPMVEKPDDFAAAVRRFLDELDSAAGGGGK